MCSLPPILQPLARRLVPQERLQPVLGDGLEPPVPGQRTQRRLGVAGHALVLGAQPPKRRHHHGLGSLVDLHSLGHQPIDPQPRHPGGAARAAGCGGTPSRLRATGGDAPRRRARRGPGPGGAAMSMTGAWRIVEMDLWDAAAIDLLGPGYIQFGADRTGRFRFIAVEGWMDCHSGQRDGRPVVEFTWEGNDEGDPASGRGWAVLEGDGSLRGHIYFHLGDDSGFRAARAKDAPTPEAESYPRG